MPFFKTQIVVTVLSETPLTCETDLASIALGIAEGDDVGTVHYQDSQEIGGKEMADALVAAGSSPDFFRLDDRGNAIDD